MKNPREGSSEQKDYQDPAGTLRNPVPICLPNRLLERPILLGGELIVEVRGVRDKNDGVVVCIAMHKPRILGNHCRTKTLETTRFKAVEKVCE
jgi:hypothetical protein